MNVFRLLDTGRLSAAANMALDKIILEGVGDLASPPTLRFLQFEPAAALVGYHQDVNLEIRRDYCTANRIDVNRRHTGGGTILFQESALGWEIFGVHGRPPFVGPYESILQMICEAAAAGLSRLGLDARFRPRNDIEVNGRKISGTGGVTEAGAFMFQGTLLVENEVDRFLRALRVPVEKLKKREIESLMERICFLSDLLSPTPSVDEIKLLMAEEFSRRLGIRLEPGGLTSGERARLDEEIAFFQGPKWIMARSRPEIEGTPIRSIAQTDAGTLRVHLWAAPGGRKTRKALIVGDFFSDPGRLIHDLEAALIGVAFETNALESAVKDFFGDSPGRLIGIAPQRVAQAVGGAAGRLKLLDGHFGPDEINELFLVNLAAEEIHSRPARWLLLPYCSKNLDCAYRSVPGCDECGLCEIGPCLALARSFDMEAVTVQSFEHLMDVLAAMRGDGVYVGSCCEAFYSKHQQEMEGTGAKGVLVNLDSTTCYDLGKGMLAYAGGFDNKTFLNVPLIEKTIRRINAPAL
jgi:lipoate-protein ligase A